MRSTNQCLPLVISAPFLPELFSLQVLYAATIYKMWLIICNRNGLWLASTIKIPNNYRQPWYVCVTFWVSYSAVHQFTCGSVQLQHTILWLPKVLTYHTACQFNVLWTSIIKSRSEIFREIICAMHRSTVMIRINVIQPKTMLHLNILIGLTYVRTT
jgi:hypothetical protein